MRIFGEKWTSASADEWTRHDFVASVLATASYFLVGIGTAGVLLLKLWGVVALAAGVLSVVLMYLVIDPKLRAMSETFARRQQEFLDHVEKTTRWEK